MPNSLRILDREDIAENLVSRVSLDTLTLFYLEDQLRWLKSIEDGEIVEIFEGSPEMWAEPTLQDELDEIFEKFTNSVARIGDDLRRAVYYSTAEGHLRYNNVIIKAKLEEVLNGEI